MCSNSGGETAQEAWDRLLILNVMLIPRELIVDLLVPAFLALPFM